MKLTIARKLLLGYLAMALLTVMAGAYAVYRLNGINELAHTIINRNFVLAEVSRGMMDTLLAQESAEKKFLVLKDPSLEEIFWKRSEEFSERLEKLQANNFPGIKKAAKSISSSHKAYNNIFSQETALLSEGKADEALALSERESRRQMDYMATYLRAIQKAVEKDSDYRTNLIQKRVVMAFHMTAVIVLLSLVLGIFLAVIITFAISRPLKKLEKATTTIAEGNFDAEIDISRHDEIGSLAKAFDFMKERLKELEAMNLDASPLTGLPGNMAIEKEIQRRLSEGKLFSLCHVDLDNFKPFADKYGYAWGSEIIKEVADILKDNSSALGEAQNDFLGHIGGDDYVIISEPHRAELLCRKIVADFDRRILKFYSEKDRQRGHIIGKDRSGKQQMFPLITVTIAIVTDDGSRFKDPLEMAKTAAELKEYAKSLPGSNYVKQEDLEETL